MFRKVPLNITGATVCSRQNTVLSGLKHVSKIDYTKLHLKFIKQLEDNKKMYTSLAVNPNFEVPYIYFPLHSQPERTTMPEGMYFDNQILAIRMLSEGIPSDWKVFVKEHPRQTNYDLRSMHARNTHDYNSINKLENVIFVPMTQNHDVLVKNCKLTATISGSISWEGLLIGKPSLIFSDNWHSSCESSSYVLSVNEVKEAINHLYKKNKNQVENDVCLFLKSNYNYFVNAALNKNHLKMFFDENEKNKSSINLSSAIVQRLEKR